MSAQAIQSYVDKWLAAHPALRVAMPFLDAQTHAGHLALAALEHEWVEAAYGVREPQVAQVKLNWWAEELAGAPASGGRHPLTQALFAAPEIERVTLEHWLTPIQAALSQHDQPTAADFTRQLQQAQVFHGAIARLETVWWFGSEADPARAERLAALDHLLYATALIEQRSEHERLALPMARLARHGLDRDALGHDSPERRAALHTHLADLAQAQRAAMRLPGPLSLFRGLDMRENQRLLRRAQRASRPLQRLRADYARPGAGTVFRARAAARAWRHSQTD